MEMRVHIRFMVGGKTVNPTQSSTETLPDRVSIIENTASPRGLGTILLVEDEQFLRDATCVVLEAAGYRVLKTCNALEALSAFMKFKPIVRLLVTDVVLPGRNGSDLANDLRAICPELKIVFISGYPENVVTRNGIQGNGMAYLPKPFSMDSLTRKVREVLQQTETAAAQQ